jgi:hypothetical protein
MADQSRLYRMLITLSQTINRVPSNLLIKVDTVGPQVNGGGFGDIHRGAFKGKAIGLKSFRYFDGTAEEKNDYRKVRILAYRWCASHVCEIDVLSRGACLETAQSSAGPPIPRY